MRSNPLDAQRMLSAGKYRHHFITMAARNACRSSPSSLKLPVVLSLKIQVTGHIAIVLYIQKNSSGDEIANVNFSYNDIFNHFYAVRPGSYRFRRKNAK